MKKINIVGFGLLIKVDTDDLATHLEPGQSIDKEGNVITSSGLVIKKVKQADRKGANFGTVVAVGDLAYKDTSFNGKPYCKVGDKVFFRRYEGVEFDGAILGEPNTSYLVIADDRILGTITESE